jgi:hypothetical protein
LDETVLIVGREIEKEMSDNPGKKPISHFKKNGRGTQQFSPMAMPGMPKVKIPENGIW